MSLRGLMVKNYRNGPHFNTGIESDLSSQNWNECLERLKKMGPEEINRYVAFKGHMLFGLHEVVPGPVDYITFLRDPVKRVISHYRHLCRLRLLDPEREIDPAQKDWNIGDRPYFLRSLDNHQVRLLAGTDPELPFGACEEKHLRLAIANMDRYFKFVGLTEQFDLSLMLLRHVCGWGRRFYIPDNIAPSASAPVPSGVQDEIRRLNQLDQQLYNHAQERFDRLVDRYGVQLKIELALYRLDNRLHRGLHVLRHKIKDALGIEGRKAMTGN